MCSGQVNKALLLVLCLSVIWHLPADGSGSETASLRALQNTFLSSFQLLLKASYPLSLSACVAPSHEHVLDTREGVGWVTALLGELLVRGTTFLKVHAFYNNFEEKDLGVCPGGLSQR